MSEYTKDALKNVLHGIILPVVVVSVILSVGLMANQSGLFGEVHRVMPFGEDEARAAVPHSTFYLSVAANGESFYEGAEAISNELREEIMGETYPTPELAMHAALGELPGNPANAHAVLLCTQRDGVISNNTGGSWHSTYHRFDRDGKRYTKTYHMLNSYPGPVVQDVFYAHIDKRYC